MFGLNVLPFPAIDKTHLDNLLTRLQPVACVVMDDWNLAHSIKTHHPQTEVIFRKYEADNRETKHHLDGTTPADWLTAHAEYGRDGIIVQAFNEPDGNANLERLAKWCAELMPLANDVNIRLALPHFSMGNPDHTKLHELNPLWDAFERYPQHLLALHEYAPSVPDEWRIGRYKKIVAYLKANNRTVPRIVITELGRDKGGGAADGWNAHLTEDQYVGFLLQAAQVYREDNIPVCIYCAGDGYGWHNFNILHHATIENAIVAYNQQQGGSQPTVPDPDWTPATLTSDGNNFRRTRTLLNSAIITTLQPGDRFEIDTSKDADGVPYEVKDAGYFWRRARWNDQPGWLARLRLSDNKEIATWEAVKPSEPTPEPDRPPLVGVWLTLDELKQLHDLTAKSAQESYALADTYRTLATRQQTLGDLLSAQVTLLSKAIEEHETMIRERELKGQAA